MRDAFSDLNLLGEKFVNVRGFLSNIIICILCVSSTLYACYHIITVFIISILDFIGENEIKMEVPTVFFGHSVGAIIAFELMNCLQRELSQEDLDKIPVYLRYKPFRLEYLIISSCRAPNITTDFNMDRFTTKYFCASSKDLIDRYIEMNIIPEKLLHRKDILNAYLELLRKGKTYYNYVSLILV